MGEKIPGNMFNSKHHDWGPAGRRVRMRTLNSSKPVTTSPNPRQSVRKRAAFLELSKTIAYDILKKDREFHPFNIQTVQAHKPMLERLGM